jgi:hypothetical protein
MLLLRRKIHDDANHHVPNLVRSYLVRCYPEAFHPTQIDDDDPDNGKQIILWKKRTAFDNLIRLNGYQAVPLPKPDSFVHLAEGVIAYPETSRRRKKKATYTLYSRPTTDDPGLPTFIEDDLPPYRFIETRVEQDLLRLEVYFREQFDQRVRQPIQSVGRLLRLSISDPPKKEELVDSGTNVAQLADANAAEDLLVVDSDGNIVSLSNMTPKLRLLSMPYTLSLKRSSTIVYTSLVLFGALPLAYRSFNYTLDYPNLSRLMTVSVVGSITYGIWSSRTGARTRQQAQIQLALNARIQARNEAALVGLQERAVQTVTAAVLSEYEHFKTGGEEKSKESDSSNLAVLDPLEVGCEIGLLKKVSGEQRYIAVERREESKR